MRLCGLPRSPHRPHAPAVRTCTTWGLRRGHVRCTPSAARTTPSRCAAILPHHSATASTAIALAKCRSSPPHACPDAGCACAAACMHACMLAAAGSFGPRGKGSHMPCMHACMQELFNADRFAIGDLSDLFYAKPVNNMYVLSQVSEQASHAALSSALTAPSRSCSCPAVAGTRCFAVRCAARLSDEAAACRGLMRCALCCAVLWAGVQAPAARGHDGQAAAGCGHRRPLPRGERRHASMAYIKGQSC